MIFESTLIVATNTDVLAIGRLNSIPYSGRITFRFLADLGSATNNYSLTLQKPDGDIPVLNQQVNSASHAIPGIMDDREALSFTFDTILGGHWVVSLTESGTATVMFQVVLLP